MKVLFYVNRYPAFGGIENITKTLAQAFSAKLQYDVAIFSYVQDKTLLSETPKRVNCYYADSYNREGWNLLENVMINFAPDIVIFQDSYAEVQDPLLDLKAKYKFRLITVEHNTPDCLLTSYKLGWKSHSWHNPVSALKKILYPYRYYKIKKDIGCRHKLLIETSDNYVLLSESYKIILKKLWGITDRKLLAIPNIKNEFLHHNKEASKGQKRKIILFVGRLTEQKGIKYLVDIWTRIERATADWNLKILGDGELSQYLRQEISVRNLKRIEILGFKSNIADYYQEASVIFMTSIFEGFPLILAEAMQFGVVPFAFDSYTALHDIVDESCGFIVRPFDIEEYVNAFLKYESLCNDERLSLSLKAIENSQHFSEERLLEKWKNLIATL